MGHHKHKKHHKNKKQKNNKDQNYAGSIWKHMEVTKEAQIFNANLNDYFAGKVNPASFQKETIKTKDWVKIPTFPNPVNLTKIDELPIKQAETIKRQLPNQKDIEWARIEFYAGRLDEVTCYICKCYDLFGKEPEQIIGTLTSHLINHHHILNPEHLDKLIELSLCYSISKAS